MLRTFADEQVELRIVQVAHFQRLIQCKKGNKGFTAPKLMLHAHHLGTILSYLINRIPKTTACKKEAAPVDAAFLLAGRQITQVQEQFLPTEELKMIGLAFPNEGITGECKHFGVVLMTQKCGICSWEEIQFTGMQKWGDERNKGYKGADLNPHTFLKLDRLTLADFNFMSPWQVHHKRIVKVSLDVLDVLNVENLLTIGAKKVAGREFFFQCGD